MQRIMKERPISSATTSTRTISSPVNTRKTLDLAPGGARLRGRRPYFSKIVEPGDFVVAGRNFGCGSSREQAPIAIKYAGVGAILAKSYSRIFFRNAINRGIPAFLCDTDAIDHGDGLIVDLEKNSVELPEKGRSVVLFPLSPVMLDILAEGGLVEYLKKHGTYILPPHSKARERD